MEQDTRNETPNISRPDRKRYKIKRGTSLHPMSRTRLDRPLPRY